MGRDTIMLLQKKILVVEDNEINRMMLCEILSSQYQVLEAENGREALAVLEESREEIALILLDIIMPVMDGYTFLSIVKANPAYASIPVIVTTQSDSESDEVTALSHGAADYVAKPYRPQVILHRVAGIINLRESAAMLNQFRDDRLTGLYSKEFFYRRVKEILQQHPEREYDIVCSDIENFKLINDVFGMPAGDRLLCGIADLYLEQAGEWGICGRLNADQFVCLLERRWQYTDEMFVRTGERVNALTGARSVVLKWGIYEIEDRGISVEQMCDRALLAARSIKGQYGRYFAAYDDKLRGKLLREQAITDSMESALAQGQFQVYLQPKYRIRDDRLAGAEALIRWIHPEWGLQSPGEFIPLFERNGFITRLDQYVWERTCAVLRAWDEKGYPPIPVSVNVSRADIYHADIAETLTALVEKYGLPPARLHLEITESAYTENPAQIIETVGRLRELGFVIEMDDFGSGYSSLNMLNQMPIDVLKLDMKFIQSETAKPGDQGILRFIMDLARWMNLSVVAEGVETKEQLERLMETGCDYVQGYYFAKPMPCEAFEELVKKERASIGPEEPEQSAPEDDYRQVLLVADEDPAYRALVRETFAGRFHVEEAADAAQALAFIRDRKDGVTAVILSLSMPGGDGFAVLDHLQREKQAWSIPVVATAPAQASMEERALELGAEDFAGKPHSRKSLWRRTLRAIGITAFYQRENSLREEACRDYLTGLLNRRGFYAAAGTLQREDTPLAVYLFDLDNLKQINDTYGHAEGDRLLVQFSALLRAHTRGSDIVARFGGDEFVVAMRQMRSGAAALEKGEELCRAFRGIGPEREIPAGCSAGIVMCASRDMLEETITQADQALYRAKSGSRGNCCLWRG